MGSVLNVPGPGSYKPLEYTGKDGPSPSVHAKLSYKPIESIGGKTPGPGAYDSNTKNRNTAPSYSPGLEQRKAPGTKNGDPSPAAYHPDAAFT